MRFSRSVSAVLLAVTLAACGGGGADAGGPPPDVGGVTAPVLRDELLEMMRVDQAERTGHPDLPPGTPLPPPQDRARAARLQAIIAEHGWPTHRMVARDGGTAAWLVAQHADFDVAFQQQVAGLMATAVTDGQADPSELALLQDRVAVNQGRPQVHGSQVRCRDGAPEPATPIIAPERVDEVRAAVGLQPLADYYAELAVMCAAEAGDGPPAGG